MWIRKSYFLREEHGRIGREAVMSWWVDKLQCQLEFTRHESQDRVAEAMGARATELLVVEKATTAKQELDTAKVRLVETKAALQKFLEALEMEQKARSEAE